MFRPGFDGDVSVGRAADILWCDLGSASYFTLVDDTSLTFGRISSVAKIGVCLSRNAVSESAGDGSG